MSALRVVVAEDSPTVRERLVTALSERGLDVVGVAGDGAEATALCERLRPDVVTMDMMMPGVTGLAATEHIMAHCPTPILIVSASVNRGELFRTYEALAAGAVDVLEKPLGHEPPGEWESRLVAAVRMAARIKVITHPRARLRDLRASRRPEPLRVADGPTGGCQLLALGASTGGPGALLEILRALPANFPLPILLVVHIGQPFGAALADWLGDNTTLPVAVARHGQPLPAPGLPGVLMAPPDRHLVVEGRRLVLSDAPPRHFCRPSVDVLFESVARELGARAAACLLTGMGRDGAAGLLALRQAGGQTAAQDELTSVVYGMPREAALLGAAEQVLPLQQVARWMVARCGPGAAS